MLRSGRKATPFLTKRIRQWRKRWLPTSSAPSECRRSYIVTRAVTSCLVWYRRFCNAWEWARSALANMRNGPALHQIATGAHTKGRRIPPEGLGRKITHLPPGLQAFTHDITGFTSASLVFGLELRLPCDMLFGAPSDKERSTVYLPAHLVDRLHDIHNFVCQHLKLASDRMKTHYDRRASCTGYVFFSYTDL
jgi:hypothetical protein